MPEGDTVHLTARRLHKAFAGTRLTRTDFRVPEFATSDLSGREVHECRARGKHILMRVSEGVTIHSRLKMEGAWHLYRPGASWRAPSYQARAVLENGTTIAVGFRLGVVELVDTREEDKIVGHLGPDPLAPQWDPEEAVRRVRNAGESSIGDVLLDQRVISGPGNVYKSEACFLLGVHPEAPVSSVDAYVLVRLIARLLQANRDTGMQITRGDKRPGRRHWVYGRGGEACYRCGETIERIGASGRHGRVTYLCPSCQEPRGSPREVRTASEEGRHG